jgi:crotonobetaine/carnitine-CoA ligase
MSALLARRAKERPDAVYLAVEGAGEVTYRQLNEYAMQLAAGLRDVGVARGSTVATLMDNSLEGVCLWFACSILGAVYVPLNTALHGVFLIHQLRTAEALMVVTDPDHLTDVARIGPNIADTTKVVAVTGEVGDATVPDVRTMPFAEVFAAGARYPLNQVKPPAWKDPAAVLFTSGTTGPSKGVLLSHNYLITVGGVHARNMAMGPGDVFYATAPLFHLTGGCAPLLASLVAGGRTVLDRGFSVSHYWQRVNEVQATHGLMIGAMIQMLWNREPDDHERTNTLRAVIAQPLPANLHASFEARYRLVALGAYGQTEAGLVVLSSIEDPAPVGWAGKPLSTVEIMIGDDDDQRARPRTVGEILIRPKAPHVIFERYLGDPEATLQTLGNLWLHSGDLGEMDEHDNVRFVDRKNDYLRRRGENISSLEVEAAIAGHPAVAEVAVVGVPSEMSEDEVKACVVLKPGAGLTEVELLEHCVDSMPYFAVPRFVQFVDQLPKSPIGRIQKVVLRANHEQSTGWDREQAGVKITRHTHRERSSRTASG